MTEILKTLVKLNMIHIPNTAALMWPGQDKHKAGVKLRNKIHQLQRNKMSEKDWDLLERIIRANL